MVEVQQCDRRNRQNPPILFILGAFVVPYFCIYFLIGTPLYFMEMSLGQFTSSGAAAAFKMSRMFKGVGWATVVNSFLLSIYYNMIIAWCLFYFFASFRRRLPWGDCGHWWNTERCISPGQTCSTRHHRFERHAHFSETLFTLNSTHFCKGLQSQTNCTMPSLPPEEYFE